MVETMSHHGPILGKKSGVWLIVCLCLTILASFGGALYLGLVVPDRYFPLIEAVDAAQIKLLTAHLRIDDLVHGEDRGTQRGEQQLAELQQGIDALLNGDTGGAGHQLALSTVPEFSQQLLALHGEMARLREQLAVPVVESLGGDAALIHHSFARLFSQLAQIRNSLHESANSAIWRLRMGMLILFVVGVALTLLAIRLFHRLLACRVADARQLQEQTVRRMVEMSSLSTLGKVANVESNAERIAQGSMTVLVELLSPTVSHIYLRQGEEMVLVAAHHGEVAGEEQGVGRHLLPPDAQSPCSLASQGQPVFLRAPTPSGRCGLTECRQRALRTIAALPLRTGDAVIGVLCLGFAEERELPALQLLLDPIVQQLASGLQNSMLFDLSRQQAQEMEKHIRLLSLSAEIGVALTRSKGLQEMLDACCTLVLNSVNAAFVRIWTMRHQDEGGDLLEMQASRGIYTRTDGASRYKRVDMSNKIGAIAVTKRPYISNHLLGDPQIVDQEWVKAERMVAFAGHPLLVDDQVIGVLGLFSRTPLSEIVIHSLAAIADTIALAITNKEATESLAKSRERYRDLIEKINEWVWKVDRNGVYTYSSPSGARLLGLDEEELIGQSMFGRMPPDEAERFRSIWSAIVARQEPYLTLEKTVFHRDGHRVILESSGVPIIDEHGECTGYRGLDRDITLRREAQNEVLHQKRLLEAMFDAVPEAIVLVSTAQEIQMVNHGFSRIFGLGESEVLGREIGRLQTLTNEAVFPAGPGGDAIPHGGPARHDLECRRQDGALFPAEVVRAAINHADGREMGFLYLISDISERKRVEEELRHAQKMEALAVLSGGIAHDFNNLLHAIGGYTLLTLEELDPASLAAKNLQEVVQATERAGTLVRHILAFSSGDDTEVKPLQLHVPAREVVTIMRDTLPVTIRVEDRLDPQCRPIRASASQIHQLLMHLCTNAYQAMQEKGGTLEVGLCEWEATTDNEQGLPPGCYARLSVIDSGQGMDDEVKRRIFEPYYTTKGRGEARGMGLSVVHGIVSSLGGKITVASSVGQGTTFTVYLPLMEQARGQAPLKTLAGRITGHVLFVDDVDFNVRLGVQILERIGCQVTGLTDSVAALKLFRAQPEQFDLVITDQTMPVLIGSEMAERMLEIRPDIPIVMVTGHSESVDEERAKTIGIRAFLAKPLMIDQLVATIETIQQERAHSTRVRGEGPAPMAQPAVQEMGQLTRTTLAAVNEHLCTTYDLTPEMVAPMLAQFQKGLKTELAKAHSALELHDQQGVIMAAHTIKGLLLNAGLSDRGEQAKALEMRARTGDLMGCAPLLAELTPALAPLLP